ncbi:jacalin-like lectin domain-containing protein [Tanacetum coccineum]
MIMGKRATLNGNCQKFNAIYKHLKRNGKNEKNKVDLLELAKLQYREESKGGTQKFTQEHTWHVLIDHPGEYLVSVSGEYLNGKLASIVFVTNKKRHGPFGRKGGSSNLPCEPFNFEFGPRDLFGGFHGSVYEGSVEAIGVYVKPYKVDHFEDDYRF